MFARPAYRWAEGYIPLRGLARAIGRVLAWLGALERRHPAASRAVVVGLVVLLALLLAHLAYVLWSVTRPTVRTSSPGGGAPKPAVDTPERHRDRAEALARAGRFTEALSQRFVAVVLELDRGRFVNFHESKTPAEYVGEPRLDESRRRSLGSLVAALYRHVFGAVPCDERGYREFEAVAAAVEQ
ncbi:MAG TPA: hypothetical protein VN848_01930 [Gemmatimonadales bacterium]|nr:hypothetical protein [Gemmatimonadales bacterium]